MRNEVSSGKQRARRSVLRVHTTVTHMLEQAWMAHPFLALLSVADASDITILRWPLNNDELSPADTRGGEKKEEDEVEREEMEQSLK